MQINFTCISEPLIFLEIKPARQAPSQQPEDLWNMGWTAATVMGWFGCRSLQALMIDADRTHSIGNLKARADRMHLFSDWLFSQGDYRPLGLAWEDKFCKSYFWAGWEHGMHLLGLYYFLCDQFDQCVLQIAPKFYCFSATVTNQRFRIDWLFLFWRFDIKIEANNGSHILRNYAKI